MVVQHTNIQLREYQLRGVKMLNDAFRQGFKRPIWCYPTGAGKCLGKNTPILMFDGSIKMVQDIKVGDEIMGVDSQKRVIMNLVRGVDDMYKITPIKGGDPFICNSTHIISLVCNGSKTRYKKNEIVNISVCDYLKLPKSVRHCLKLYRTGVDFPEKDIILDPYFLGLWLGDGDKKSSRITTADFEVVDFLKDYASKLNLRFNREKNEYNGSAATYSITRGRDSHGYNLTSVLKYYRIYNNKHIPKDFLYNSEDIRLNVLAGLIDSDGYLHHNFFEYTTKLNSLKDNVAFLARSLGFQVNIQIKYNKKYNRNYFRLNICGDIDRIPTKIKRKVGARRRQIKNVLRTGFYVESIGKGNYYGFSIEGKDKLFLLGDFTVTHNSTICSAYIRKCLAANKRVLFFVHSKELVQQFALRLKNQFGIPSGIIMAGVTPFRNRPVQVASVQTLVRRKLPPADIIFIDECHRSKAKTYLKIIEQYPKAIIVGLTATPFRGDGKGLGDIFDTIVQPVRIRELIKLGYLVPTKVFSPKESADMTNVRTVRGDFDLNEMYSKFSEVSVIRGVVENYLKHANGKKAIVFNVNIEHSQEICEEFKRHGIAAAHLDGTTNKKLRTRIVHLFKIGKVQVLCNVALFCEGFDIPDTECVIINRATKSKGLYVQIVGRGLRPANGKEYCIVLDHGGNTLRHGFVEDYDGVPFSLEGEQRLNEEEDEKKVKECPSCAAIMKRYQRKCDNCDFEFPVKQRTIKFGDGQEFTFLDREATILERLHGIPHHKVARNVPLSQLRIYGLLKGYKNGWWFHTAIDDGYLEDIDKAHNDAFGSVRFRCRLAEIEGGTHELYLSLKAKNKKHGATKE